MGKLKTEERKQAADFFVNAGLTIKEISSIVKVAPRHISKWRDEDGWETQRTAKLITVEKLISDWYGILQNINAQIRDNQNGLPTSAQTDQQSKISDNIYKLSRKNNLSLYSTVLTEFLSELQTVDVEAAKILADYTLDFLKRKANKLKDDTKAG